MDVKGKNLDRVGGKPEPPPPLRIRVNLIVQDRYGCPFRRGRDPECLGFFSVGTCQHPKRLERKGPAFCDKDADPEPNRDPYDVERLAKPPKVKEPDPFPPACPLRNNDTCGGESS